MWSNSIGFYLFVLKCPSGKIGSRLPNSANICQKTIWRQGSSVPFSTLFTSEYYCLYNLRFFFFSACAEIVSDRLRFIDRRTQHPANQHSGDGLRWHPWTSAYCWNAYRCSASVRCVNDVCLFVFLPIVLRFRRIV